jgi:hypothetical protein
MIDDHGSLAIAAGLRFCNAGFDTAQNAFFRSRILWENGRFLKTSGPKADSGQPVWRAEALDHPLLDRASDYIYGWSQFG